MLDFPNAPTDGQAYSAPNGLTYYYDASPGLWKTGLFNTVPQASTGLPSVKDYGAVGDGIHDDAPAFGAAATLVGSGKIYVPPGTYFWNTAQNFTQPVLFVGNGWNERNGAPERARQGSWILVSNTAIKPITFGSGSPRPCRLPGHRL
jgi:hypothetical protein